MRALLIGALAATLVGCSCLLPPQASVEGCPDANGLACFERSADWRPIQPKPASFKTDSSTIEIKSAIEKRATVGAVVPLPKPKANNKGFSSHAEAPPRQRGDAEKAAPASNEPAAGSAENQPADTAWIVSETTSPVDYAPLTTAVINSTSSVQNAPNTLAVRCRGAHTELLLRTEGAWRATRASESSRLWDQRPTRCQATVDCVPGWEDRQLQRRCSWTSAVAARRRTAENQRVRLAGRRPGSDVPTHRIG